MPDIDEKGTRGLPLATVPLLIAHRGASGDAPENTLAAFELAWEQGADGIEADFRLTRDGHIVCLHDAGTGRTAGVELAVAQSSLQALRQLDVGRWRGTRWTGERIPLLEEVLQRLPAGKIFLIELKCGPEIIPPLRRVLTSGGVPGERLRLLTFDRLLVPRLKEALPELRVCLNVEDRRRLPALGCHPTAEELLALLAESGADGLSSQAHPRLDRPLVDALHARGLELHVWTVDALHRARHYCRLGVDSIMTNRPGRLRPHLQRPE